MACVQSAMALSYSPFSAGGPPAIGIRVVVIGLELYGAGKICNRFVVVAVPIVRRAPVTIGLGIFRVETNGLGEVGYVLVVVALLPVGEAPPQ